MQLLSWWVLVVLLSGFCVCCGQFCAPAFVAVMAGRGCSCWLLLCLLANGLVVPSDSWVVQANSPLAQKLGGSVVSPLFVRILESVGHGQVGHCSSVVVEGSSVFGFVVVDNGAPGID